MNLNFAAIEGALVRASDLDPAPGFVAMISGGEQKAHAWAFGRRSAGADEPMSVDSIFWIASLTKLVTSIATLCLIEEGVLDLHAPVAAYRPDFADIPILEGFDLAGAPRLRRATDAPTVRHLLTHTSGLGYTFMDKDLARLAEHDGLNAANAYVRPRLFEAGASWRYGSSTDWLGLVIEAATGCGLNEALSRMVFAPLGMSETMFAPTPEMSARQAGMHARLPDGAAAPVAFSLPGPEAPQGGGGLFSTAADYMRLLRALLDGEILSEAHRAALFDNAVGDLEAGVITSSMPAFTNPYDPMPGRPKRWSLGLMVNPEPGPDGRPAGCGAWAGLANCYYWMDPTNGVAGLLLSQILPFADPKVLALFATFERAVYVRCSGDRSG